MDIAFVCTEKLPSPAIRGGAIQLMIDGVAPYFARRHRLTIFSVTDPELATEEAAGNIRFRRFDRERYTASVASALAGESFDIVHVFNRPKHLIEYKRAHPEQRFVLSLHNEMFKARKIGERDGEEAVSAAERIMTVSRYIKETLVRRFPQAIGKTDVVYSGVDLSRYHPVWTQQGRRIRERMRATYGCAGKKVILFVGRLSRSKGPHLLIQAMKYILEDHPDALLMIAGGKWFSDNGSNRYTRYLHELAEPLADRVRFTNYVPAERIADLYTLADVFVCSSQWQEPLARVHYEAMAAGIPIITTNRGGNGEVVRAPERGLLIDAYDKITPFVRAVDFVFSNPFTAEKMAKNARAYVETHHSFSQVARRMERIYEAAAMNFKGVHRRYLH